MNEQEALELSWSIAQENGFKGDLEEYKISLNSSENLNKAFQ